MADKHADDAGFDLDRLQQLVELMERHDLREVKLQRGDEKWYLRRGPQEVLTAVPMPTAGMSLQPPVPPPIAGPAPARQESAGPAAPRDDGLIPIKSPMVGTFYRAPSPEDSPFAKEGDRVTRDSVVCLIEAMKFFNQVKADCSGTIVKVLAKDGDAVEFGQPLFMVQPE